MINYKPVIKLHSNTEGRKVYCCEGLNTIGYGFSLTTAYLKWKFNYLRREGL